MKKLIIKVILLFLTFVLFTELSKAQDPVADALLQMINAQVTAQTSQNSSQLAQLATTSTQATATANTVANTLKHLQDIEKTLQTVNAVLTTVVYVKNITTREKEILKMQSEIASNVQKMKNITLEELQTLNNNLLVALKTTESFISLTNDLLKDKTFRMGDDSRLSQFFSIDEQLAIQQSLMRANYMQYAIINEERAISNSIKKR
jgi:hypothetical protein